MAEEEEYSTLQVDYAKLKLSFRRLAQTVIDDWIANTGVKLSYKDKYDLIAVVGDAMHDIAHKVAMQIDYRNSNGNDGETRQ